MDARNEFKELSMHDISVIEEAKALIEKLNTLTEASSARAVHELPSVEPTTSESHDDDGVSDFSGYSMLTPSSPSKPEHDDEMLPLNQQVHVEEQIALDGESHAPEFDVDRIVSEAMESNTTVKQPLEDDINVFQAESEPANGKRKLTGVVITFEQAVDFDIGQNAAFSVGDHLGASLGSQAKEIHVLAIEGNGYLEVSIPPHPEPSLESSSPGHETVELVAQIHRVDASRTKEHTLHGSALTVSSHHSSFFPPQVEPIETAATPNVGNILQLNQIELAKARTLRALVGPNNDACSGNCLNMKSQEAGKETTTAENIRPPTLSELIDIAKTKIHRELTNPEHLHAPDAAKEISTKPKEVKTKKTKSTKKKCTSTLAHERFLVGTASILLLAVISLVFCLASMSTARRGHFLGLWLGS